MKNMKHILNEGFDRLFETKKVIKESAPDAPLTEKQKKIYNEIKRTIEFQISNGDLLGVANAVEDVISRYFPNNSCGEVCGIDIYDELARARGDLFALRFTVPANIVKSIKPEFLGEEKEYGLEDCDDEECKGDECNESSNNDTIGDRVAEYQKWVDYDMKKYGKISGKTMGILKREGFTIVKDEYGDLEVIPEEKDHSPIKESKESDVKGWWDEVEKWNAENGNKYTIDNEDADVEDMRVAMWDMLMELKGVAPELYQKGKKIYNKYRVFTKITEGKRSNKRTFRYDVGDNKYSFYCETEDTRYGFRHLCSMFLRGQEVGDSVKKYYNRTWEMFDYQSAMLSAVENSSVSEEDKKSLKAQINEGEGLREGKECNDDKCLNETFYGTEDVLKNVSKRTKARLQRVIDTQKKYGNDMEISVMIDSPYKAHLTYGEGGANYYKDEDGQWKHDIGYIKIDSSLANSIISDVCKAAGMCDESKQCEGVDDDDISDEEYYAELEKHIAEIPSYDDEKLKAEYKEFKDSTHEDDIRVETALKDEMVKRGFLFVYEGMKVLNENAPNFAVQDGLPIYAFLNYEEEYDNIWGRAKEEYEGEVNDDGWDEFLEDFEEKYFDEYLKGYAVIDPENDEFDGKTLNDAVKDFNDMLKGLANKAYDVSADAWREYENARDSEDVSDEDADKLNDKANELDDIYSYLRDLELMIQSGYHQGYQLYLDGWDSLPEDFPQEYIDAIVDAYNKVGKDYHLMKLGLAYQASNGEAGYSLIED